jgi:hypothetical protein
MNTKFISIFCNTIFCISCMLGCRKETKIPCIDDFAIVAPVKVSHLNSKMKLDDTLSFRIEISKKSTNSFTGDTVDVSLFSDLWGGLRIVEYIKDSSIGTGGFINSISARASFLFLSDNNIFEIPNDLGRPSPEVQFFKYSKENTGFILNLKIIPKKKGTFAMVFLASGFRDAICYNRISHSILNYNNKDYEFLLEEAMGKPLYQYSPYNPELYIIKVE